ncbi:MAG: response regulator [Acidobacteriota bacterium]
MEDALETRDAMLELLTAEGYQASAAANGFEALSLLEKGERPSLILLDLFMPVMDGWEFCRQLAARPALSEIPIAIVSATGQDRPLPERKSDAGHFRKPIDLVSLLNTIRRHCN